MLPRIGPEWALNVYVWRSDRPSPNKEQTMKKEEIKELSVQELRAQIEVAEKAYRELKVAHAISPVDNPSKITKDRKEIARLKTVLRQKEIAAAAEKTSENK